MLICLVVSGVVVGFVVREARRDGREVLTPYGQDMWGRLRPGVSDDEVGQQHQPIDEPAGPHAPSDRRPEAGVGATSSSPSPVQH